MSTKPSQPRSIMFALLALCASAAFAADPPRLKTSADPAMLAVDGKLFMIYRAADTNNANAVSWAIFDGTSWFGRGHIPARYGIIESPADVAVAAYAGKVFIAYQGVNEKNTIYWAQLDPRTLQWTDNQVLLTTEGRGLSIKGSPALAALGDRLYLTYQGQQPPNTIYWASYDGRSWRNLSAVQPTSSTTR